MPHPRNTPRTIHRVASDRGTWVLLLSIRPLYLSQRYFVFFFYAVLIPALYGDPSACHLKVSVQVRA
jgi:hypothetical protein